MLVTIDTLRADRLGSYGSTLGLTPALDGFARDATRFTAAVSQVPLTLPAHTTILTGLHPARHGARTNDGFRLASGVPTLAEQLRTKGYRTAAFIGGYPLRAASGLARGFERYDDDFLASPGATERSADEVVRSALDWIAANRATPFFAWIHLFDPHSPYTPPAAFAAAHRDAPYDGEIAYTDAAVGRLLDRLRQLDLYSSVTIIVVADHGESLGEHGERTHGTFLYDATIHVPLLIKMADRTDALPRNSTAAGSVGRQIVDVPVQIADLAPTIAAAAGTMLAAVDAESLLPLLEGATGDPDRPVYAESYYQNVLLGWSPLRAVRSRHWKYIEAPRPELYDLDGDPQELRNHVGDRLALASGLRQVLMARWPDDSSRRRGDDRRPAPAPESAQRLRSLGYASGSTTPSSVTRMVDPKDRIAVWTPIEDGIDLTVRDPAAAGQAFRRALQLDPDNGLAMKYLADLEFRSGRLREARDGYRRAIAAGFRHPDSFVNLASIAEREGQPEEAHTALATAVELDSFDADTWNRLGLIEARRGDVAAARRAFSRAIELAGSRPEPFYNLGLIERRAGNEPAAQARLQEALARNPAYPEAHYELGTGYLRARQPERALDQYRAALAGRPGYAEALFGAARAELDLGRRAEARRDYERFVRVAPPEYRQQIAAARDEIRRLGSK